MEGQGGKGRTVNMSQGRGGEERGRTGSVSQGRVEREGEDRWHVTGEGQEGKRRVKWL